MVLTCYILLQKGFRVQVVVVSAMASQPLLNIPKIRGSQSARGITSNEDIPSKEINLESQLLVKQEEEEKVKHDPN